MMCKLEEERETSVFVTTAYNNFSALTSDITQICAVGGEQHSSKYVLPSQPVMKGAMEVTGLEVLGGVFHCKGQPVASVTSSEALVAFMDFLSQFPQPPILLGHNIKTFDGHVLYHHLQSNNMCSEFNRYISGFADTKLMASPSSCKVRGTLSGYAYQASSQWTWICTLEVSLHKRPIKWYQSSPK